MTEAGQEVLNHTLNLLAAKDVDSVVAAAAFAHDALEQLETEKLRSLEHAALAARRDVGIRGVHPADDALRMSDPRAERERF